MQVLSNEKCDKYLQKIGDRQKEVLVHVGPLFFIHVCFINIVDVEHAVVYHLVLQVDQPRGIND